MKAFLFSDLHANYKQLDNIKHYLLDHKDIGLVIFAGDFVNMGEPAAFADSFLSAIDEVDLPLFWVPGNNDFGRAYYKLQARIKSLEGRIVEFPLDVISTPRESRAEKSCIKDLSTRACPELVEWARDDKKECKGLIFTGVGGSPASWSGQYAGERALDQKDIAGSIFVSHVPPPGIHNYRLNDNQSTEWQGKKLSNSPIIHICGHIHQKVGVAYLGNTKIVKLAPAERGQYAILDLKDLSVEFKRFDIRSYEL